MELNNEAWSLNGLEEPFKKKGRKYGISCIVIMLCKVLNFPGWLVLSNLGPEACFPG
jgi:hypothetical protein